MSSKLGIGKIGAVILCLIVVLAVVVTAVAVTMFVLPQNATVPEPKITAALDGEPWLSGTPVDWGPVGPTQSMTLAVTNNGTTTITVALLNFGLPAGWAESWTPDKSVLAPGQVATGPLRLDVPVGYIGGYYSWTSYIDVS